VRDDPDAKHRSQFAVTLAADTKLQEKKMRRRVNASWGGIGSSALKQAKTEIIEKKTDTSAALDSLRRPPISEGQGGGV